MSVKLRLYDSGCLLLGSITSSGGQCRRFRFSFDEKDYKRDIGVTWIGEMPMGNGSVLTPYDAVVFRRKRKNCTFIKRLQSCSPEHVSSHIPHSPRRAKTTCLFLRGLTAPSPAAPALLRSMIGLDWIVWISNVYLKDSLN
ncbi:hypothetical protein LZ32DRAFT_223200 [Colletotrichum eremochloae]|nr:hypothetical protein LZ32DRAFT_223200 [Colletotrichum eremochloae]